MFNASNPTHSMHSCSPYYCCMAQVLRRLLNLRRSLDDSHYSGPVYICVSDVSSAFDALNRDEAYNVSCELLNQGHYFLKRSDSIARAAIAFII